VVKKLVLLDWRIVIPTDTPRLFTCVKLGEVKDVGKIDLSDAVIDDIGDGKLYVRNGHHRIGRIMELTGGKEVEVEVKEADIKIELGICIARNQLARKGIFDYRYYIHEMEMLRVTKERR